MQGSSTGCFSGFRHKGEGRVRKEQDNHNVQSRRIREQEGEDKQHQLADFLAKEGVYVDPRNITERDVNYFEEIYRYQFEPKTIREHAPYGYSLQEWKGMKPAWEKKRDETIKEKYTSSRTGRTPISSPIRTWRRNTVTCAKDPSATTRPGEGRKRPTTRNTGSTGFKTGYPTKGRILKFSHVQSLLNSDLIRLMSDAVISLLSSLYLSLMLPAHLCPPPPAMDLDSGSSSRSLSLQGRAAAELLVYPHQEISAHPHHEYGPLHAHLVKLVEKL